MLRLGGLPLRGLGCIAVLLRCRPGKNDYPRLCGLFVRGIGRLGMGMTRQPVPVSYARMMLLTRKKSFKAVIDIVPDVITPGVRHRR